MKVRHIECENLAKAMEGAMIERPFSEAVMPSFEVTELRHRMKNNLQIVAALLRIQARQVDDEVASDALQSAASRITAFQKIDGFLDDRVGETDAHHLLELLIVEIQKAMIGARPIALSLDATSADIGPKTASGLGMIANELVTNALKHAFPDGRSGIIKLRCEALDEGLLLEVQDDGVGIEKLTPGLGMSLIRDIVARSGGSITLGDTQGHGTHWRVLLPLQQQSSWRRT